MSGDVDKKATWAEISAARDAEMQERKTLKAPFGELNAEFIIRRLTTNESDICQALMHATVSKKKEVEIPASAGPRNAEVCRYGIVSGPEGFDSRNRKHIDKLGADLRDEIASCIDDFSALDEATQLSFREARV